MGSGIPVKAVVVLPHLVDTGLHLLGFIHLGQFFHHTFDLSYSLNFRPFCHDWGAGPHRPAVRQIAAQLQQNALCALTQQKRPGPFGSGRTNVRGTTWIRKTRTLRRICACPVNGGPPPGLTDASAPVLRDDFSGGFGRTHTNRSLSWPLPTGYCFPSSQFAIFYFSIVYPGSIVKRQLSRRISFFSREMMRFSSREM